MSGGGIPPKLPPRNPPSNSDPYDSLRGSGAKVRRAPSMPSQRMTGIIPSPPSSPKNKSFIPHLPKGNIFKTTKSPSHDSLSNIDTRPPLPPPPSSNRSADEPPPLPDKPKPGSTTPNTKRPPAVLPPARAVSIAGCRDLKSERVRGRNLPSYGSDEDSSSDEFDYDKIDLFKPEKDITPFEGDDHTLAKFVKAKQKQFPVAFETVQGFSSHSEDVAISEGERFIAHFLKHAKMFTIKTESEDTYTIPLNTSFQFAILHNPNNNTKEALSGFVFKTAGDIMLSKALPKVIRAKRSFRGAGPQSCVSMNELLFVKEVVLNEGERRFVKCVQVEGGTEKHLHEDCHGDFTTAPHEVRVYLSDIVNHFQLPLETLMCMGPDNEEDIPSHLVSTVATVLSTFTEHSLIASSIMDDRKDIGTDFTIPDNIESITLNDIPLNFGISVDPIPVSPTLAEKILRLTDRLYTEFDPVNVVPYLTNYSRAQLTLIKSVLKDNNRMGISLEMTDAVKSCREAAAALARSSGDSQASTAGLEKRLKELETQNLCFQKAFENISGRSFNVVSSMSGEVMSMAKLQTEHARMKTEIEELKKTVEKLSNALSLSKH